MADGTHDEAQRILTLAGGDYGKAVEAVQGQFSVLVLRTQVMLSLSGIVVTVTGFSGRAIAETSDLARLSISVGILLVLSAAVVAIGGVLRLRWLTQELGDEALPTIRKMLVMRDQKTKYLAVALGLFTTGFACYCLAIAQLLLAAKPHG